MTLVRSFRSIVVALFAGLLAAPAAFSAGTVTFSASGDIGRNAVTIQHSADVLKGIAASSSQFHLALGDFSYTKAGTEPTFCKLVTDNVGASFPFELIAGNHDAGLTYSGGGYETHIDQFVKCLPNRLPGLVGTYGRKWYVDQPSADPSVRIIMATPNIKFRDPSTGATSTATYLPGTAEYDWVANAIDDARAKGIPWVIVGVHYPCLTAGDYTCNAGFSMGKEFMAMLIAKKVDLVLGGHEHLYQRSYQLGYGVGCPTSAELRPQKSTSDTAAFDPDCIRSKSADTVKGDGTIFATVGTGGVALKNVALTDPELGYFAAYSGLNVKPSWGSLILTATSTRLSAKFTPAVGTFTDAFSISQPTTPLPPDADADGVPDATDLCRLLPGPATRRGCPTTFLGTAAANTITGTGWSDTIAGLAGNDVLRGLGGNDRILGGPGADTLIGDGGNDTLFGGTGRDTIRAGIGNDTISVRDRTRDVVYCGFGRDTVTADRIDVLRGCERVTRR